MAVTACMAVTVVVVMTVIVSMVMCMLMILLMAVGHHIPILILNQMHDPAPFLIRPKAGLSIPRRGILSIDHQSAERI